MEEKQIQEHQEQVQVQQQQALKCPRCDSSNTKFCYYNNYSLSQPRHFCKACKRYWTRGGTLRNVPVGGGYRKNKRVKKGSSIVDRHTREFSSSSSGSTPVVNPSSGSGSGVHVQSHITTNPLLYSLLTTSNNRCSEVNNHLPYSIRDGYINGLNHLPQFKVGGNRELGFSSVTSQKVGAGGAGGGDELGFSSVTSRKAVTGIGGGDQLGFSSVTSQNPSLLASLTHPLLSSTNYPIYGTSTSTSTMASSQQKIVSNSNGYNDNIAQTPYGFMGFDDLQMLRNNEGYDVKMEGHGNWFDSLTNQNFIQEINSLDQSFMWNSSVGGGVRPNPSNIGC